MIYDFPAKKVLYVLFFFFFFYQTLHILNEVPSKSLNFQHAIYKSEYENIL